MATVRFNLKDKQAQESLIYLIFRYDKQKLVYSNGIKLPVKSWNDSTMQVRRGHPECAEINQMLYHLKHIVQSHYTSKKQKGFIPSTASIKEALCKAMGKEPLSQKGQKMVVEKSQQLIQFFEQFIAERKESPMYSSGIVRIYQNTLNHMLAFQKYSGTHINFESITLSFFNAFTSYLFNVTGHGDNNVAKIIKTLKTVLNEATERGLNTNMTFRSKKFTVAKKEVESIYLTIEELQRLQKLYLEFAPNLERIRDAFLIGAYTGLRFSDFTALRPENISQIDGVEVLCINTQKTGEKVVIPLHPIVRDILTRYKGFAPATISNQKMNQYLKEIGKLAKFTDKVVLEKSRAGKRYTEVFEKWELISTHTARRSFATNAYKSGISSIAIMKITGHKSETSFLKYIKVSKEENAVLMAENGFFKEGSLKGV